MPEAKPDICVLASFSGEGGVERMLLNLVDAFARHHYRIDLLLIKSSSRHLVDVPPSVETQELGSRHTATSLLPLVRYLRRRQPARMLIAKDRAGRLAIRARALAGTNTRLVLRLGTNLSAALAGKHSFQRWLRQTPIRRLYPKLDHIIAVSEGVAQDTLRIAGLSPDKVSVVRNPVVTPRLIQLSQEAPPHPWLQNKSVPVVLGAGRLTVQKDFPTLLRAFAVFRDRHEARLIILGEGERRQELVSLARELGVESFISLPGFTPNPYAYMAHADLFVLSSRWEGSPNVLTEALALGVPVVATNCPSGPAEILRQGEVAPLVPIGDFQAMAAAMDAVRRSPRRAGYSARR